MALKLWWSSDPAERYWMEIADRSVLGENLLAPQADGGGRPQWSYSLVAETRPGDLVLHWHRRGGEAAIVGWSEVTGPLAEGTITWQARGTRGRERGEPTTGPSWEVGCGGFNPLVKPVTGTRINELANEICAVLDQLERRVGTPTYFPFVRYRENELRAAQAYLTKFPAALVDTIPELADLPSAPRASRESPPAHRRGGRAAGAGRTRDPLLRTAVERYAVDRAKAYYLRLGASRIVELGAPYDLHVELDGIVRHVEVKGSSVRAVNVELTVNEVAHAGHHRTDLVVVDEIDCVLQMSGHYRCSGGNLRIWSDWRPAGDDLAPTQYRYRLPEGGLPA